MVANGDQVNRLAALYSQLVNFRKPFYHHRTSVRGVTANHAKYLEFIAVRPCDGVQVET
jgi:hypothetical protein